MTLNELRETIEYMEEEYGPECLEFPLVKVDKSECSIDMLLISSFVWRPYILVRLVKEKTQ